MLPDEWRKVDFSPLVDRAVSDMTKGKKKGGRKIFVRVGGQSGAGKSTQLIPMVEEYFRELGVDPVMVTTRAFVKYHPYLKEIMETVAEENLREATHEFAVQMLFEVLLGLIEAGYPTVLDVTLLDPKIERLLTEALLAEGYESELHMMAVAKEISDQFIRKREGGSAEGKRKVRKGTSGEFMRATPLALKYYAERMPEMGVTMWSAWEEEPVYNGRMGEAEAFEVWERYQGVKELPFETDEEKLREAKKEWGRKKARGWRA